MSGTDDPGHPEDEVGSVSEEAAKLLGALSGWARDQDAGHAGQGLSGLADHAAKAARAVREVDQHLATGDAECTWCPICRTVHAVRRTSPEVRAHLATAASSLLQAAAGLLATAVPTGGPTGGPTDARTDPRGHGVERIDLDADDAHDEGADPARSEEDEQ